MDYETACTAEVTKAEAIREIRKHGVDPAEFFADAGERATYQGSEILNWLGY